MGVCVGVALKEEGSFHAAGRDACNAHSASAPNIRRVDPKLSLASTGEAAPATAAHEAATG